MNESAVVVIVISFVFGLCNLIFASWLSSQRAEKSRVDILERQVTALEERAKHVPSASDLVAVRELTGEVRALVREVERLHERFGSYEEGLHRAAAA